MTGAGEAGAAARLLIDARETGAVARPTRAGKEGARGLFEGVSTGIAAEEEPRGSQRDCPELIRRE